MKVHDSLAHFEARRPVVTTGTFDGVHLGHQKIIDSLNTTKTRYNGESVVISFWPHPRTIIQPDLHLPLLNTLDERIALLEKAGVDHLVLIRFTKAFSRMTACDFIHSVLAEKIGTKHLIVGYNHRFGRDRQGNIEQLRECARPYNIPVEQVPAFILEDTKVSSTVIRELLGDGQIKNANKLLGYPYTLTGQVIFGNQIGRTLGFPTANIEINESQKLMPRNGVYVVEVIHKGTEYNGMLNIGVRPTIRESKPWRVPEVNIFNFNKNIYGETITVKLMCRVRSEIKFQSLEALRDQLHHDKEEVINQIDNNI